MISYSCTANIEIITKAHNNNMLNNKKQKESYYNCAGSCKYPLKGGNYWSEKIVSKATVISELETRFYIGLCSTQFIFRYDNHKKCFKCGMYKNDTKLSKYICVLKRKKNRPQNHLGDNKTIKI